tara:strand:+ start:170 stop:448 length:279 start_codon:yes stop_codon:yes gene_type:complete
MNKTKELVFASCKDINGAIEYIAAYSEEEIEVYCENGVLRPEKEILAWYTNPTPIMVSHHFEFVGKGKRPAVMQISRPFNYTTGESKIDNSF